MATQTVNFIPPSDIITLTSTVSSINTQVGGLGANTISAGSGTLNYNNVDARSLLLTSTLNGLSAQMVNSNSPFQLEIDSYGVLRITCKPTQQYSGYVTVDAVGKMTINGSNIQSCWYLNTLIRCLTNPVDAANLIGKSTNKSHQWTGVTPGSSLNLQETYNLYQAQVQLKFAQAEIENKIPPVTLSICKAMAQGVNDAIAVLPTNYKQSFYDFVDNQAPFTPYQMWDSIVRQSADPQLLYIALGSSPLNNLYAPFIKYVNNYTSVYPNNPAVKPDLGVPSENADMTSSCYLHIGNTYMTGAKGIAMGSPHNNNVGLSSARFTIPRMICDGIDIEICSIGGMIPFPRHQYKNQYTECHNITVAAGDSFTIISVDLVPASLSAGLTGTQYYIGNEIKSFDWEGPVKFRAVSNATNFGYTGYTGSNPDFYEVSIPRTIYGPIYYIDMTKYKAYCFYDIPLTNLLAYHEEFFKNFINIRTAFEARDSIRKWGYVSNLPNEHTTMDNEGRLYTVSGNARQYYPKQVYSRIEKSIFEPTSVADVDFFNTNNNVGGLPWETINGSDPHVATAIIVGQTQYGYSPNGQVLPNWTSNPDTDVVTTFTSHGNTQYTDLCPTMDIQLERVATIFITSPTQLFKLTGTGANLNPNWVGPLEQTRLVDRNNYFAAMRQAVGYDPIQYKTKWCHLQILKRANLLTFTSTGSLVLTAEGSNIANWASPPTKINLSSAQSIDFDKESTQGRLVITKGLTDYLRSSFLSSAPNFSSAYLAPFATGSYSAFPALATTGTLTFAADVLANWDRTYSLSSTGALLATAFYYRAHTRARNLWLYACTGLYQASNSLYAPLLSSGAAFNASSAQNFATDFMNALAPTGSQWTFDKALPNFTFNASSGTWVKTRELTDTDKWTIFRDRLLFPQGVDVNKVFEFGTGPNIPASLFPCTTIGELFSDALVAAVADISRMSSSYDVTYVTSTGSLNVVTSSAATLPEKLIRPWGHAHTLVYSNDFDSSGRFRQYACPYGQDSWFGGQHNEIRNSGGNASALCGAFSSSYRNVSLTGSVPSLATVKPSNDPSTSRQIFSGYPGRALFPEGYMCIQGGSCYMKMCTAPTNGFLDFKVRTFTGFDTGISQTYRKALYYLQNDLYPTSEPTIYTFTGALGYNASAAASALQVPSLAINNGFPV